MTTAPDARVGADVVHLCFRPPWAPGSFNRLVGVVLEGLPDLRQVVLSHGDGPPRGPVVLLPGPDEGPRRERLALRLPERARRGLFGGIGSPDHIRYARAVADHLAQDPPTVVLVWDDYKLGSVVRDAVGSASHIVLSQHGRRYHLPPGEAAAVYRRRSFDTVVTHTLASYRAGRDEVHAYEPLVCIQPNGVDVDQFRPADVERRRAARERWELPDDRPVVVTVSQLIPAKGTHLLVHSWDRVLEVVPDALLWVVGGGDDDYRRLLEAEAARQKRPDAIRFQGIVAPEEVPECLAAADLFAFPSVQDEGHPLAVLEAMASGLACVVADSPVVRELHETAVELVADPNVEDAFVAPLVELLLDPAARAERGAGARAHVEAGFTLEHYLDGLGGHLRRLVASAPGR